MLKKKNKIQIIFFYTLILIFLTTLNNRNLVNLFKDSFKIKFIEIHGVNENIKKDVNKQVKQYLNPNILSLKKKKIIQILENNEVLNNYKVIKKFPSTLILNLEQTDPLGIFFIEGKKYYLGSNGNKISSSKYNFNIKYPIIYGNFEPQEFFLLINKMKKYNFNLSDIEQFYYFENKRWDFKTKNKTLVKLPNSNLEDALKLIITIQNSKDFKKIIDLRVSNQVIITNE